MHRFFASTKNTRPVLPGSLRYIRSDAPLQVTEEEKQWLAGHNITTVVDLRTERERAAKPCPLEQDGRFRCLHLPVTGGDALPESPAWVAQSYINMADDRMERILKTITEAESNVLFFAPPARTAPVWWRPCCSGGPAAPRSTSCRTIFSRGGTLPPIWNNTPGQTPASIWQSSPRSARPWSGSSAR